MTDPKKMKAKEIREKMEETVGLIDDLQNEYEEYEQELMRRGLKA